MRAFLHGDDDETSSGSDDDVDAPQLRDTRERAIRAAW